MRILVVTHDYPPPTVGGYGTMAADVCRGLASRGHIVHVLTTNQPTEPDNGTASGPSVTGSLRGYYENGECIYPALRDAIAIEQHNLAVLRRVVASFQPEVVSLWHMGSLSLNLIPAAVELALPLVFVIGDDWLVYGAWADGWHRRFLPDFHPHRAAAVRRITGLPTTLPDFPRLGQFYFVSDYTRDRAMAHLGVDLPGGVIPPGLPPAFFEHRAPEFRWNDELLWVGRVGPPKGVLTALRALAELPRSVRLHILGPDHAAAAPMVQGEIDRLDLRARVAWSHAARSALPAEYRKTPVTLFTSEIEHEAFGLVALEAMASGSVVVSTAVGGNAEVCRHDVNCLTYPAGDASALAAAILRLRADAALRRRLGLAAMTTADRYTLERQVAALERAHAAAIGRR